MSCYSSLAHFYFQGSYYSYDEFEELVHDYLGQLHEYTLTVTEPNSKVLVPQGAVISYT